MGLGVMHLPFASLSIISPPPPLACSPALPLLLPPNPPPLLPPFCLPTHKVEEKAGLQRQPGDLHQQSQLRGVRSGRAFPGGGSSSPHSEMPRTLGAICPEGGQEETSFRAGRGERESKASSRFWSSILAGGGVRSYEERIPNLGHDVGFYAGGRHFEVHGCGGAAVESGRADKLKGCPHR